MRIRDDHYYVMGQHPGVSGFQRWAELEESVVTGRKARLQRSNIIREYLAKGVGKFRLGDGHLPEYQPQVSEVEALRWLDNYPYNTIYPLTG